MRRLARCRTNPTLLLALVLSGCAAAGMPTRSAPHGNVGPQPPPGLPGAAFRLMTVRFDPVEVANASGFFVSAGGLAVTCAHVLDGGTPLAAVLTDGRRADVEVVAVDVDSDLAFLRVRGSEPFPFLAIATRTASAGEEVWTLTQHGVGAATFRGPVSDEMVGEAFELSTSLGPGASGGAVVNANGRLLGVVRGGVDDDPRHTVAIPAARVADLLRHAPAAGGS